MFGYWADVPDSLRPFYDAAYKREAWLRSALVPHSVDFAVAKATRLAALAPEVIWADGPGISTFNAIIGAISQGLVLPYGGGADTSSLAPFVAGMVAPAFSYGLFADKLKGGGSISESLARGVEPSAARKKPKGTHTMTGKLWSDVLPKQQAVELAARTFGAGLSAKAPQYWPNYPGELFAMYRQLGMSEKDAKSLALVAFLRDQGVSQADAESAASGKLPGQPKASGQQYLSLGAGISSAPKAAFSNFGVHLKPAKKPATTPGFGKVTTRDAHVADLAKGPVPYVLAAVLVVGLYVVARRFGG